MSTRKSFWRSRLYVYMPQVPNRMAQAF